MQVSVVKNNYAIEFTYKPYLVEAVKSLPERRWDDSNKVWLVPTKYEPQVTAFMSRFGFKLKLGQQVQKEEVEIAIKDVPTGENLDLSFMKLKPYPFQVHGIAYGIANERVIIGDQPGLGKAQPLHANVATPTGWKMMGFIKVGDDVIGADGNCYKVEGVFPQGIRPIYKVTFNDGSSTECDEDHLWSVRDVNRRRRGLGWIVKTTKDLLATGLRYRENDLRQATGRKQILKWEIPLPEPFDFEDKQFIIHPYILGALIGDGSMCNGHVCISIPDFEIETKDRIEKLLPPTLKMYLNKYTNCPQYYITQNVTTKKNPFMAELERLGLDVKGKEKFIPEEYLFGSKNQRLELLRGLMDTDGSAKKGRITFHTCSRKLAHSIANLAFSLGGQAILREYDRSNESKSIEWQVNIRLNECPFYIQRKIDQWGISKRNYASKYIESIKPYGHLPAQCIKVSAPDSLYLTDHFIVTHNTIQSIGIVTYVKAWPCLVICPSSLKENWRREFEKVTGKKAMILTDAVKRNYKLFYEAGLADVFIVNYESLKKYFVSSISKPTKWTLRDVFFRKEIEMFKSVIIDELHRCKSSQTHQSKFTKGITTGKKYVIGLTGTPVVNKPKDLVSQLFIINQMTQVFGNYKKFVETYCAGTNEASNLKELNALLRNNCFIRREKQAVLTDLPDKQRQVVVCDISNRKEYDDAEKDLIKYLKEYKDASDEKIASSLRGEIMVKIGILKNISARGKLADVFEFVDDIMEAGETLILFIHLKEVAAAVLHKYHGAVSITGADDMQARQSAVDRFQNDPKVKLIVCSIKAAGVGLTLTASSRVGFIEFPWTYADCEQCEDRAHRIGQKDSVTCYYFLGKNTIDGKIYKIIQTKKAIAQAVTGSTEQIPENIVDMVANLFNQKDDEDN